MGVHGFWCPRISIFPFVFPLIIFFLGGRGCSKGGWLATQSPLPPGSAPGCYNSPSSKLCFVLTIIQTNIPATNDSRIVKATMGRELLMAFQISLSLIIHDELVLWMRTTPGESKILMKGRVFFVDFVLIALHWKNKMNAIIKEKAVKLRSV